jgi:hypothetical protein
MHAEVCLVVLFIPSHLYDVLAVTHVLCHLVIYPLVSIIHHLLLVYNSLITSVFVLLKLLHVRWVHCGCMAMCLSCMIIWGLAERSHCSISILYVQDVVGCDCDQRQAYPMLPAADLTSLYDLISSVRVWMTSVHSALMGAMILASCMLSAVPGM